MEFRFLAFWVVLDTWIGKVQPLLKYLMVLFTTMQ